MERDNLIGCGVLPDRSILHQMSKAAYSDNPTKLIDGFKLVYSTPTLKFYLADKTMVVAIRGTVPTDKEDIKADASIPLNKLKSTVRYQKDMSTLIDVMKRYPTNEYTYYGVGHSLGGAILDMFIEEGWIQNGVSYNPAVQPKDFKKPISNQRIYQSGDPLYNVMGRFASNVEVRQPKKRSALEQLISKVPYVGTLFSAFKNHQLDNFEGGVITHRERFLKKHKLEDKPYSVEELAKISGYSKDVLREVYNRGIGAYKTNPTSVRMKGSFKKNVEAPMSKKLSKEQWAMARLYSFLDGNPKHDTDLRGGATAFEDHLRQIGYSPKAYLSLARKKAKEFGYDSKELKFARNGDQKLVMKKTPFGKVGYNDFLIYSFLEKHKKVPEGTAEKMRQRFVRSHSKIKGDWKSDDYSANNLALRILW